MLKLFDPDVSEDEVFAAKEVLLSHNWASGAGLEKVRQFEEEFRSYVGCKAIITVNSGTAALHLALALFATDKTNVFLPSLSFVSTAHAARYNRANVIFVDVDPLTLCMDPDDLERKLEKSNTAAVMPVHFAGMPCNIQELKRIANTSDYLLIDDAAHACGASYHGRRIGNCTNFTCFSFHPVKNLSMPSGGAIAINSVHWKKDRLNLLSLRWCGIDKRIGTTYDVTKVSPNYYMNELSAAIGLVQLRKLDKLNRKRRNIALRYHKELKVVHKMPYSEDCSYHMYWILSNKRKEIIRYLHERGIEVGTHYRPIHTMTAYKGNQRTSLPVTEKVGKQIVTIPIHTNLSDDNVTYIINTINSF